MSNDQKPKSTVRAILLAIFLILIVVIAWHLFFPVMGAAVAVTGVVWGVLISTILVLSLSILLFFIFSGVGILILGLLAFIWVIVAIALFPVIFPLIVPILIIMFLIAFIRGRKQK